MRLNWWLVVVVFGLLLLAGSYLTKTYCDEESARERGWRNFRRVIWTAHFWHVTLFFLAMAFLGGAVMRGLGALLQVGLNELGLTFSW